MYMVKKKQKNVRAKGFALMKNTDLFEFKITKGEVGTVFSTIVLFIVLCIS